MIEALMKICGAFFIGGIGLMLILVVTIIFVIIIKELIQHIKERL